MRVQQVIEGGDPRFCDQTFMPEIFYHGDPRIGTRNYGGRLIGYQTSVLHFSAGRGD